MEENNTLTIFSANKESSGAFTCQVTTALDTESLVHHLTVLDKTRMAEHPRHRTVKQGDSFVLECSVRTDPELLSSLRITWRHNKEELVVEGGRETTDAGESSLSLVAADGTAGGRYDCVADTRLDSVTSRAAYVTVDGEIAWHITYFVTLTLQLELIASCLSGRSGVRALCPVEGGTGPGSRL